ncbi:MAG: hypothetical protein LRZ92_05115 [Methanosarcinaceae archaeon]|nr:hypothetical protein [Methanosarcinaceae archaeon]
MLTEGNNPFVNSSTVKFKSPLLNITKSPLISPPIPPTSLFISIVSFIKWSAPTFIKYYYCIVGIGVNLS